MRGSAGGWDSRRRQLYLALHESAFLDGEPAGKDIAAHDSGLAQFNPSGGADIAGQLAEDHQVANIEVGHDAGVRSDGEAAIGERDRPLQIAVHVQVFIAGELSSNDHRFADDGGTFAWLHALLFSPEVRFG